MSDNSKTRVVVGMSGGVDSSVTALCLQYLLHHLYLLKKNQALATQRQTDVTVHGQLLKNSG